MAHSTGPDPTRHEASPTPPTPPAPTSLPLCVAIVGATGAVGEVLLRLLDERRFPIGELRPLASKRSAGAQVSFRGDLITVREATPDVFAGVDIVFFAATGSLSQSLAPEAVRRGAVVIDKSSTFRMDPTVPLVVPEINGAAVDDHVGIISSPNCTTTGVVMALEPLRRAVGLRSVVVTTFQAVSGSGRPGLEELERQVRDLRAGGKPQPSVYAAQIAENVVPLCDDVLPDGFTAEEDKLQLETRKILATAPNASAADADLPVSVTCVRVPVPVGHSASMLIETGEPVSPERASALFAAFPGVEVIAHPSAPTTVDVAGRDAVIVGRIRRDRESDKLWVWQVGDNLRKGAATNAIQIAETLIERRKLPLFSAPRTT